MFLKRSSSMDLGFIFRLFFACPMEVVHFSTEGNSVWLSVVRWNLLGAVDAPFSESCFKLPAANDVFPEDEGKHDDNGKKMKDSSEKKKGSSCSAPIVVSYFPLGSNLSRL
ncbi:hypothetical protein SUGI_0636530 [Cryptomeria japonica]|nr:hypothetical protein SUGI_0636530 [Cryptomeria japonica]